MDGGHVDGGWGCGAPGAAGSFGADDDEVFGRNTDKWVDSMISFGLFDGF
jgi:hypothetical protein